MVLGCQSFSQLGWDQGPIGDLSLRHHHLRKFTCQEIALLTTSSSQKLLRAQLIYSLGVISFYLEGVVTKTWRGDVLRVTHHHRGITKASLVMKVRRSRMEHGVTVWC